MSFENTDENTKFASVENLDIGHIIETYDDILFSEDKIASFCHCRYSSGTVVLGQFRCSSNWTQAQCVRGCNVCGKNGRASVLNYGGGNINCAGYWRDC